MGDKFNETIEQAALRETKEEINVLPKSLEKIAELSFYFPHNPAWDQAVHVYFVESWEGEPQESEEMLPKWFKAGELPFKKMWPDDIYWVPEVLNGNLLKATFQFGQGDVIQKKEINIVSEI